MKRLLMLCVLIVTFGIAIPCTAGTLFCQHTIENRSDKDILVVSNCNDGDLIIDSGTTSDITGNHPGSTGCVVTIYYGIPERIPHGQGYKGPHIVRSIRDGGSLVVTSGMF